MKAMLEPCKNITYTENNVQHQTGLDGTTLYLYYKNVNAISAGVPYIIKWKDEKTVWENPVFNGVIIPAAYANAEDIAPTPIVSDDGKVSFKGNFNPVSVNDGESILFLGTNNTLYYPHSARSINAFRAYFQLSEGQQAREFRMNFGGDRNASGITTTNYTNNTNSIGAWYDLSGRLLIGRPNTKGMYIHNGHKVVVK